MANIAGLDSIRNKDRERGNDDSESNRYYVGGNSDQGGGSGLSVIGNSGSEAGDAFQDIISQAQAQAQGRSGGPRAGARTVTFYSNGFTVDDGPLRSRTDPANKPFLDCIANSIVPKELEGEHKSHQVDINLVDKRLEEYEEPPTPQYVAFSGAGHTVRSSAPSTGTVAGGESAVGGSITVNAAAPTTTLQIRLHNGDRLLQEFNLSHTIRDIQSVINSQGAGEFSYVLLAGFPPKQLQDASQTILDAGLEGAAVTQKLV